MRPMPLTLASLISILAVAPSDAGPRLRLEKQQGYFSRQHQIAAYDWTTEADLPKLSNFQTQSSMSERERAAQTGAKVIGTIEDSERHVIAALGRDCTPYC